MDSTGPILRARIEEAGYPGGFSVRNVSFDLDEGEVLLVAGRSGSGKTTLLRAVTQTIWRAGGYLRGSVELGGRALDPASASRLIAYVPQEPWFSVIGHTVWAEFCLAARYFGAPCERAPLEAAGLGALADDPTFSLSAGQLQRLLVAEGLWSGARVLAMDEPLVYLDRHARRGVVEAVGKLAREGIAALVVDHMPSAWSPLRPRLLLLDGGRVKYHGEWAEAFEDRDPEVPARGPRAAGGASSLEARGIWFRYPGGDYVLRGIDFSASFGELVAVVGPNGSGKTTLLKVLSGILSPQRGRVVRRAPAIYVPENPVLYFSAPTPAEELATASSRSGASPGEIVERLGLGKLLDRPLAKLSSGERRRVALASAMLLGARILLLDEPTGGLDHSTALELADLLVELVREGRTIVASTHDERLMRVADRIFEVAAG
ncbi:MAG: ATP-binding cassette domain-containing protein [Desulfurococcaceae archaeon]